MTPSNATLITPGGASDSGGGGAEPKDRQFVTALARGLKVLRCFAAEKRELGSSEIARLTGLPQPTVWRLCKTLQDEGYLLPGSGRDQLQLSPSVLGLGYSALASMALTEVAKPAMQEMANRFGAACSMATRNGLHMILVQRCQGQSDLVLNLHVGSQLPLTASAIGTAYIACMSEADRASLYQDIKARDEPNWPAREAILAHALRQYAADGFIVDCGGFHPRINTAAAAFNASGGLIYSLSCGAPAEQLSEDVLRKEVGPALLRLSKALASQH
ncbi:transcriptional regulator [Agaricicola taiwanensis]|uniref:Transcriptional regulator n=1 Tax=Agaricicola taiwanensis TaxID=591372 RepID=A0A8J3E040_9RHOB|nr:IclR family transcriptional regulator [Agaricicola taiwanensis]GGE50136.1 transcriptional regulator [Agaricicola taiwanensis]